ncbi:AtpZ/AtpI family protein [Methylotetracoccus oryzae]|uniref:AtpZ/AtpI family protein n=1 Tax=Methylotetracoccus oryzae TaxID=1919059 RepID=UPI0011199934|nr:AtpZ/AtpI family protein [Methylotetracoccus oryzae]
MKDDARWEATIRRRVERMRQAERDRPGLLAQTAYLGTLGLVVVLPMVGGAFLGRWLDERLPGFCIHWTLSLLFAGLVVGVYSAYLLIKRHE